MTKTEPQQPAIKRTIHKTWHLSKRAALAMWRGALVFIGAIAALSVLALFGVGIAYWGMLDAHASEHAMWAVVVSVVGFCIVLALRPKKEAPSHDYDAFLKQRAREALPEGAMYTLGPAQGGPGDLCIDFETRGGRDSFLANRVLVHKGGSTSVDFAHITFGGARVGENGIIIHCRIWRPT